jgi:hypothetical protein
MRPILIRSAPALCAFLLLPFLAGCDILGSGGDVLGDQLRANERKWAEAGPPQAYRLDVEVVEGADTTGVPVRIHVRDGAIASAFYAGTDEPLPQSLWAQYPTVEGLFAIVRNALSRRVAGMGVNYDQTYGFPRQIGIDYDSRRFDDDLYIITQDFATE